MDYIKFFLCVFLLAGCLGDSNSIDRTGDTILARVGNKVLYESDIAGPIMGTAEDSLNVINSYVEQWVRRMIVLDHAEENVSSDINIDKLVDDYRSSLLLHNYRLGIVERNLDTIVRDEDLTLFYEEVKGQYSVSEPILRGMIIKIDRKKPEISDFYKDMKNFNYDEILSYAERYAELSFVDTSRWYSKDEFISYLPVEAFSKGSINKEKDIREKYEGYEYFVKIIEYVDASKIPPLSYIEDKIKRIVINQRKKELLEDIESKLYKDALNGSKIKVYTK